jgi:hypothetical protein
MRRIVPVFLLCLLGCSSAERRTGLTPWTDTLRVELLRRVAEDQVVRERFSAAFQTGTGPDTALVAELRAADSANTLWLRNAVTQHGWPDRDVVGRDGANAAFLLVQHADHDTSFQAKMLTALVAAFERGQAAGQSVALLTDRVAVARGELQPYGTQTNFVDGRIVLSPVVDSANVDARRARMGLPPLHEYLRVLDSIYLGRTRR